jgi:hypothetical protein
MSKKNGRWTKDEILKQVEKERRIAVRLRLNELRGLIRDAQRARREAVQKIALDCRAKRLALRESCGARRVEAREQLTPEIERRKKQTAQERAEDRLLAAFEAAAQRKRKPRSTARERRAESDDVVRGDIDPVMVPVFNRVKHLIKDIPGRQTRTEAFLDWAHDNPGDVYDIQEDYAAKVLAKLEAEQHALEKAHKSPRRIRPGLVPLEQVPF